MALKVSSILPIFWPKKFLIFKQLFLRRVQVSYNVVSYNKNKVYELLAVGPIRSSFSQQNYVGGKIIWNIF